MKEKQISRPNSPLLTMKDGHTSEPLRLVKWITKQNQRPSSKTDEPGRPNPRKIVWSKESLSTLFPNRIISLHTNNQHDIQNQHRDSSHDCKSSGSIRSQKASLDKKEKLTVVSKRLSVRKINDFMALSFELKNEEDLDHCAKNGLEHSGKKDLGEQSKQKNSSILNLVQKDELQRGELQRGEDGKKRKIRISLRRERVYRG